MEIQASVEHDGCTLGMYDACACEQPDFFLRREDDDTRCLECGAYGGHAERCSVSPAMQRAHYPGEQTEAELIEAADQRIEAAASLALAEGYAAKLIETHGLDRARTLAYSRGYGLDEQDAKRCERLAAAGDENVLQARLALEILRRESTATKAFTPQQEEAVRQVVLALDAQQNARSIDDDAQQRRGQSRGLGR